MKQLNKLMKEAAEEEETHAQTQDTEDVIPGVFLTGSDISSMVHNFSLNTEQALAFRIICNHTLGHHQPSDRHLLMGVFGEGWNQQKSADQCPSILVQEEPTKGRIDRGCHDWQCCSQNQWNHGPHHCINSDRIFGREEEGQVDAHTTERLAET